MTQELFNIAVGVAGALAAGVAVVPCLGYLRWHPAPRHRNGGLTSTDDWTQNRWDLIPMPESCRPALRAALRQHAGAKYDWFSLLAFVLPGRWSDSKRLYCFELPALVLGISTRQRVTPERILHAIR